MPKGAKPILTGELLGQMKDEYPDHEILEFCSGGLINYYIFLFLLVILGAKQYALMIKDKEGKVSYPMKIRGITLDFNASTILQYSNFKSMCQGSGEEVTIDYPQKIQITRDANVVTRKMEKIYKTVNTKGVPMENYKIRPIGHKSKKCRQYV